MAYAFSTPRYVNYLMDAQPYLKDGVSQFVPSQLHDIQLLHMQEINVCGG
jgi:hypothetical protein